MRYFTIPVFGLLLILALSSCLDSVLAPNFDEPTTEVERFSKSVEYENNISSVSEFITESAGKIQEIPSSTSRFSNSESALSKKGFQSSEASDLIASIQQNNSSSASSMLQSEVVKMVHLGSITPKQGELLIVYFDDVFSGSVTSISSALERFNQSIQSANISVNERDELEAAYQGSLQAFDYSQNLIVYLGDQGKDIGCALGVAGFVVSTFALFTMTAVSGGILGPLAVVAGHSIATIGLGSCFTDAY